MYYTCMSLYIEVNWNDLFTSRIQSETLIRLLTKHCYVNFLFIIMNTNQQFWSFRFTKIHKTLSNTIEWESDSSALNAVNPLTHTSSLWVLHAMYIASLLTSLNATNTVYLLRPIFDFLCSFYPPNVLQSSPCPYLTEMALHYSIM